MYYYSKNSREKIVHLDSCFHLDNMNHSKMGCFQTLSEAYEQGYKICKHCNPLFNQYKKEKEQIIELCRKKGVSVFVGNKNVVIRSINSKWKITVDKNEKFVLYHKNTYKTENDHLSQVKGYHLQGDVNKESIVEYLDYVLEHDYYRMMHPVYIHKQKKEKAPPRKGTNRYKSLQHRIEKNNRKQAISNVLNIIDSLSNRQAQISTGVV